MSMSSGRRRRQLTPEEKWEVFVEVTSQQLTQRDAARKWGVDVSVIIKLRKLAKDAALAAFAAYTNLRDAARRRAASPHRPPERRDAITAALVHGTHVSRHMWLSCRSSRSLTLS